jgi:hypothetical protein
MEIIITNIKKIKDFIAEYADAIFSVCLFIALGLATFSLGMIYERDRHANSSDVYIDRASESDALWEAYESQRQTGDYFGSRNGTKIYTRNCSAGQRIKDENRIYFKTIEQATSMGYTLSDSC